MDGEEVSAKKRKDLVKERLQEGILHSARHIS